MDVEDGGGVIVVVDDDDDDDDGGVVSTTLYLLTVAPFSHGKYMVIRCLDSFNVSIITITSMINHGQVAHLPILPS